MTDADLSGPKPQAPSQQAVYRVDPTHNLPETSHLSEGKLGADFCLYMTPSEFLLLTPKMGVYKRKEAFKPELTRRSGLFKEDIMNINQSINWLSRPNTKGTGVLNLWVKRCAWFNGRMRFIVSHHDGRHRAGAALILGIERVPVKIRIEGNMSDWVRDAVVSDFDDLKRQNTAQHPDQGHDLVDDNNYLEMIKARREWISPRTMKEVSDDLKSIEGGD